MKMANKIKAITTTIMVLLLCGVSFSQTNFKIDPKSKMSILGTSTIHDWESAVTQLEGNAIILTDGQIIESIENLNFLVPVLSIESGNAIMDGKTHTALKYKTHPNIQYKLKALNFKNGKLLKSKGLLTVAGVTREVDFPVECIVDGSQVNIVGKINFKMTDFNVDPPTALLGTLKTGDDIIISFNINFRQAL